MNANVSTNTTYTITSGVYTSDVVSLAADFVAGTYKDYYFFQYTQNDYVLLVGDISFHGSYITALDCTVYEFVCSPVSSVQTVNIPFSGSQSGQYGGSDGAGGFNGSVSGNSTISIQTDTRYNVVYTSLSAQNITINNTSGYLDYGSADYMPHLTEGVENYAFTGVMLCIGICLFKLCDRIFRRVY